LGYNLSVLKKGKVKMAGISAKSIYGISALVLLAKGESNTLMQIKDIAMTAILPQGYLEQILPLLKAHGFVESVRGANGGYRLSKSPKDIILHDVLVALEGCPCEVTASVSNKGLAMFWDGINVELRAVFSKSLQDILDFQAKLGENLDYNI
jgi:Rrf2 family transcriptional regulator, cysteine metabolism repressor